MKIAMIGHKRIPSRSGGIEVVVEELTKRMIARGNEVDVYNRHSGEEKIKEYNGAKIIEIPTFNVPALHAMLYSLFATIRSAFTKYDVVHYHAEGPCVMIPLAKLFGKKTVATIHGLDWQRSKWGGFATKYLKFGEKMAAKYADEIIVLSEDMKNYFRDVYQRETTYIPNGVTVKPTNRTDEIEKLGLERNSFILYLGRFAPEKRADLLYEAFTMSHTKKKLVFAGDTSVIPENTKWFKEAKQNENVMFLGHVEGDLKRQLFSNAAYFVLPSDLEGMSISLLEALGYGMPVIASDIYENMNAMGTFGIPFEKGNARDLAVVIDGMEERPFYRDVMQYTIIKDNYSWTKTAQTIEDLAKSLQE